MDVVLFRSINDTNVLYRYIKKNNNKYAQANKDWF